MKLWLGFSIEVLSSLIGGGFLFPGSQISDFGNTLSPTVAYNQGSAIETQKIFRQQYPSRQSNLQAFAFRVAGLG